MNIAYTIMTVDDSRKALKDALRENLPIPEVTDIDFVDARVPGAAEMYMLENGVRVTGERFHYGELGVWFSQMNCWKYIQNCDYDGVIVLEDDAVVHRQNFDYFMPKVMDNLPGDYDFLSLAIPADQKQDYYYDRVFNQGGYWRLVSPIHKKTTQSVHYIGNSVVCTAYQGYSCVATMYSPQGAAKMLELVNRVGLYTPVDCFLFLEHFKKNLNGYSLLPNLEAIFAFEEKGTIARATGMYN